MGADIYLKSKFDANNAKWKPLFDNAVKRRDALPRGSAQAGEIQKEVHELYGRMYEVGYFRDPYNDGMFLGKIGLSWWNDVVPMLDKDGFMPIEAAKNFREQVATYPLLGCRRSESRAYFEKCRAALVALLDESIRLNEPLLMSL